MVDLVYCLLIFDYCIIILVLRSSIICCLFSTISHVNYWDQVNSWKNLWKFWNDPLCRINQAPPPYSMLQYIGRVATPKPVPRDCLRYLQTTLMMGGGGLVSEFMWAIVGKQFRRKTYESWGSQRQIQQSN